MVFKLEASLLPAIIFDTGYLIFPLSTLPLVFSNPFIIRTVPVFRRHQCRFYGS